MEETLLVFCADTHCGSSMGLIKPEPFQLHDGGQYYPSPSQELIWRVWEDGWSRIQSARKGKRLVIVHVGDAAEGLHHNTTEIISSRVEEHEQIHIEAMDWAMQKAKFGKGDALYYVAGTEEHTGSGSRSEERIAADIDGVIPPNDSKFTWNAIRKEINGVLFDVSHHGGTAGNTRINAENPLRMKIKNLYFDCLDLGMPIPRFWIRAHIHRFINVQYNGTKGTIEGLILPSLQMKTGYVYKKMNTVHIPSDIGLCWIEVNKTGEAKLFAHVANLQQDKVGKW